MRFVPAWIARRRANRQGRADRGFRPSAEGLEDRRVPSAVIEGGILRITGTAGDDKVELVEDRAKSLFRLVENGVSRELVRGYRAVDTIEVDLGDGDDSFVYRLKGAMTLGELFDQSRAAFDIDMGNGNDFVDVNLAHTMNELDFTIDEDLTVNIEGGPDDGRDTIIVRLGPIAGGYDDRDDPDPFGTHVQVTVEGGGGDDYLGVLLTGDIRGHDPSGVEIELLGGSGDDTLDVGAHSAAPSTIDPDGITLGDGSFLTAKLYGQFGADIIGFGFIGSVHGELAVDAAGGWGNDSLVAEVTLTDGSTRGVFDVVVNGGWDDDTLYFWLDDRTRHPLQALIATLDGDLGNDILGGVTGNVRVVNI